MYGISYGHKKLITPSNGNERKKKRAQKLLCKFMKARHKVGQGRTILLIVSALLKCI